MLTDYKGPSNSPELLKHLVGDTITGAFIALNPGTGHCHMWLVLSSGDSLVLGSNDGGVPVYWKASSEDTKRAVDCRQREIQEQLEQLRQLGTYPSTFPDKQEDKNGSGY